MSPETAARLTKSFRFLAWLNHQRTLLAATLFITGTFRIHWVQNLLHGTAYTVNFASDTFYGHAMTFSAIVLILTRTRRTHWYARAACAIAGTAALMLAVDVWTTSHAIVSTAILTIYFLWLLLESAAYHDG